MARTNGRGSPSHAHADGHRNDINEKLRMTRPRPLPTPFHSTIAIAFVLVLVSATSSCIALSVNGADLPAVNSDGVGRTNDDVVTHTLLLCRHGDSIWNGGEPGTRETFTGWTDVPLSQRGVAEAVDTGRQVSTLHSGVIDACFTSILGRATLTAHHCLWAFADKPCHLEPRRYVSDYRLNERHYGALQGYVKQDVEDGLYGHDPDDVQRWRRKWTAVPPLLDDDDPRRLEEVRRYANHCGGIHNVPRGESLAMVASDRIRPFLDEVLTPILDVAAAERRARNVSNGYDRQGLGCYEANDNSDGGTGLVVAHANSLRALIGVICNVEDDPRALHRLESLRIPTGVPLVMRYRRDTSSSSSWEADGSRRTGSYWPCNPPEALDLEGPSVFVGGRSIFAPDLPCWPLSSLPNCKSSLREGVMASGRELSFIRAVDPASRINAQNEQAEAVKAGEVVASAGVAR